METLETIATELGFQGEPTVEELHERVVQLGRDALMNSFEQGKLHQRIDVALVREAAEKPGFFRACLGMETADAMANGTMGDDETLRVAEAHLAAIQIHT